VFNMPEPSTPTPLAQALGRVPSGLFVLTVHTPEGPAGMLASWVQQAAFEPPMITVALAVDRALGPAVERSGRFALSQIGTGHRGLIRRFGRSPAPGENLFDGLELHQRSAQAGAPIVAEALSYLIAEVTWIAPAGDHRVVVARVRDGALLDADGEPVVHVRRNGLRY
jgi:flavin reductase (DIM6/NTAB) family NADH-FMN oxidoreductase RutF